MHKYILNISSCQYLLSQIFPQIIYKYCQSSQYINQLPQQLSTNIYIFLKFLKQYNNNQLNSQIYTQTFPIIQLYTSMINQITVNSNNAIQLSRGQLLSWVNSLLKLNYSKIQQLGTGAAYSQLLDIMYPGKVPLNKINWKAKFDYQYLNNFKILQQSFTKLNIMKHIDVEKLVKCKYQDNLQFLQWFKKIFDNHHNSGSNIKQYDALNRRGQGKIEKQKQNKNPVPMLAHSLSTNQQYSNKQGSYNSSYENSKQSTDRTMQRQIPDNTQNIYTNTNTNTNTQRYKQQFMKTTLLTSTNKQNNHNNNYSSTKSNNTFIQESAQKINKFQVSNPCNQKVDQKLINIFTENQSQEKEYYLKKIKQIEYLMDTWNLERKSQDLIQNIRKIILATPQVQWCVQDGQYMQEAGVEGVGERGGVVEVKEEMQE